MGFTDEFVRPATSRFTRLQWLAAGLLLGFFLGFVDTVIIAALLGFLGLKVSVWFGIPTTFSGYFFTGMILGALAPEDVVWEPVIGVFIIIEIMMTGLVGLKGHGIFFFFHFVIVPVIAAGVCYGGLLLSRRKTRAKRPESQIKCEPSG
jgi:hypothetical protein